MRMGRFPSAKMHVMESGAKEVLICMPECGHTPCQAALLAW